MSSTVVPSTARRTPTAVTFALLGVSVGSFSMLQSLVSPALPALVVDLHTTQAGVSWVVISVLLSAAVGIPILGRVGDMIGKEKTLLVALGAIAVGTLVSALAPNLAVMVTGRVIQGFGGAVYPIAFGIIRDEFEPRRVPSAVGAISSVIAVGGGLGTVLAGPIVDGLGWRWLFWLMFGVAVTVGVLAAVFVPASPVRTGGRINWGASVLLTIWLVALLLPVCQGQRWGWASPVTITSFVVAAVTLAAWIVVEARSSNPVVDMQMMRSAPVWTTNLVGALFGASMFAAFAFVPQFVQTPSSAGYGFGTSVTVAGLLILPMLVTMALGGMVSGPIHQRVGFRAQLAWGSALLCIGCLGFGFWNDHTWQIAVASTVAGFGLGLAYSAMTSVIVEAVPATQTATATGMNTNIRNIGGAIGTAIATAVITASVGVDGFPTPAGYAAGFTTLAAMAAVGVGVSLLIPSGRGAAS
ncbi:MFS transporter [Mycolicibacterium sp.]|uniref:MFS transporter n=1 Tax=Mycolicibacterium sp. TaxID=2320850 RepID=UPI003D12EDD0